MKADSTYPLHKAIKILAAIFAFVPKFRLYIWNTSASSTPHKPFLSTSNSDTVGSAIGIETWEVLPKPSFLSSSLFDVNSARPLLLFDLLGFFNTGGDSLLLIPLDLFVMVMLDFFNTGGFLVEGVKSYCLCKALRNLFKVENKGNLL